ncbi:DUF3455 domain-containing protein [Dyella mobilis]|uniref:DUF3455 domain-containing protein n=1 Tax=Dyella mobilis TaxID=1849582 RepID=A0ABS2KE92_9GAMM|nr:DUF3455 domain-containing protein [Dyella mobilis]MBM7129467.1 DUF3455 domain-containing protein [Dyella mobilis]GLQ98269.1 hypothetical protein GCM10007863_26890 [Dyella mobilis]
MNGKTALATLAAATCLIGGITAARAQEPVPATLQPPAGYTVAFTAKASGVQIYTSTVASGSTPTWTFEAPLAELTSHGKTIHHYAGPTWEAADGSKVVEDKDVPVIKVPSKQGKANIPWLLIKVSPDAAPGILSKVAYVQRISTAGGVAPTTAPARAGTKVGVPYSATYVFYFKSN